LANSIPLPSIKWGKHKERSAMADVFTEDGRIVEKEMVVSRACIDDEDTGAAFMLDAGNQFIDEKQTSLQILWERTCFPVCPVTPGKDADLGKVVNEVYKENRKLAVDQEFNKAAKADKTNKIIVMISIVCGTFIIIAAMRFLGG